MNHSWSSDCTVHCSLTMLSEFSVKNLLSPYFFSFFFKKKENDNETANIIDQQYSELRRASHWTVAIVTRSWPRSRVNQHLMGPRGVLRKCSLPLPLLPRLLCFCSRRPLLPLNIHISGPLTATDSPPEIQERIKAPTVETGLLRSSSWPPIHRRLVLCVFEHVTLFEGVCNRWRHVSKLSWIYCVFSSCRIFLTVD